MKRAKLTDYPKSILKEFSENAKRELAEQAIAEKDYPGLTYVIEHIDYPLPSTLFKAIDYLDTKAIQLILDVMKNRSHGIEEIDSNLYLSYLQSKDHIEDHVTTSLNHDELRAKKVEIIKVLLEAIEPNNITSLDLDILISVTSKQEFDDFCTRKKLDLTEEKFKNQDLSKHEHEASSPVLEISNSTKAHSLVDLLLSRTYTDNFSAEQLKIMYTKLYNLNSMAKEMMTYMSTLIANNNSIKLIFEKNAVSSYSLLNNIIKIDANFQLDELFTIESVLMHEIEHAIYANLFDNKAQPFSIKQLSTLMPKYKTYLTDRFSSVDSDGVFSMTSHYKIIKEPAFQDFLNVVFDYEKSAKLPIAKAAELLRTDAVGLEKYYYSLEYVEHFKFYSYIDLFLLNDSGLRHEAFSKTIPDSIFNNILNIYLNEHLDECSFNESYTGFEEISIPPLTKNEITRWAVEEYLPKLVKDLDLSPTQIHFLERIADYANRGYHWLDMDGYDSNDVKYVELIVRALEIELVPNMESDIIESFQGLKDWHHTYVYPEMHDAICNGDVYSLPFSEGMTEPGYDCTIEIEVPAI